MKKINLVILLLLMILTSISCKDDNLCTEPINPIPQMADLFDFSTQQQILLDINLQLDNCPVVFSLFTHKIFNEKGEKDQSIDPIYTAFTNKEGCFKNEITLPCTLDTLYFTVDQFGINYAEKLAIKNKTISFHVNHTPSDVTQATNNNLKRNKGKDVFVIIEQSNLKYYSLYNDYDTDYWLYWHFNSNLWVPQNTKNKSIYKTLNNNSILNNNITVSEILQRIQSKLTVTNNASLVHQEQDNGNLILTQHPEHTTTKIEVTLLNTPSNEQKSLAYYYYKTNSSITAEEIKQLPKFFIIPKTGKIGGRILPSKKVKTKLRFFGDNYNRKGSDLFPTGYTIGWMLISEVDFAYESPLNYLNYLIAYAATSTPSKTVYSNHIANIKNRKACLSLYDEASASFIVGIENDTWNPYHHTNHFDYDDLLFAVNLSNSKVYKPQYTTVIEDESKPAEIITTETTKGTLAFEDIWPYGGDYDMNDVVIEYERKITFNNFDEIKKIEDNYKVVHCGAEYTDAFGCIINNNIGEIDESHSFYACKETNNQFIFFEDAKKAYSENKTYTLTRTFNASNCPKKSNFIANYNPFIVSNYIKGQKNRTEVHLPKHNASEWINHQLIGSGDDLFYIYRTGKYPFAIDLFNVTHFNVSHERKAIDTENEYPYFKNWVNSNGKEHKDWYLHKGL